MITGYITHEEATINRFIKNPEYAAYLISEVKKDGDKDEIAYFQHLYDEAKVRLQNDVRNQNNTQKITVQDGHDFNKFLPPFNKTVGTVEAVMA